MKTIADIDSHRLSDEDYKANFSCLKPKLSFEQSLMESERCYYCYDAPCIEACPTEINIPSFIKKINQENPLGAAETILSENILGGTCARACPVETLCEEACVRTTQEKKPVKISALQQYSVDKAIEENKQFFKAKPSTNKRIAIVGAGPAGLACAHRLSWLGHQVTLYDAKEKAGGLNEYGLASYKMVDDFAQKEIEYLLEIGNIDLQLGFALGDNLDLSQLKQDNDAVFLALGLTGVNQLKLSNERVNGVYDAIDFISDIRQSDNLASLPIGRRVIVIGGGNTAIDIASQVKRLGAEEVTLVYRRNKENMNATEDEQALVKDDGVLVRYLAAPIAIQAQDNQLTAVEFERTTLSRDNQLEMTEQTFHLPCDMLFKAIGQHFQPQSIDGELTLELNQGRIKILDDYQTSVKGIFSGGDCIHQGEDLTVEAVQEGKLAAHAIDRFLKG